jgi:hypothetical protein
MGVESNRRGREKGKGEKERVGEIKGRERRKREWEKDGGRGVKCYFFPLHFLLKKGREKATFQFGCNNLYSKY